MRVSVALTPRLLRDPQRHVIAVVDVLRATSTLVTMFDRGLIRAMISDSLNDARQLALRNFSLLCGESKMQPLPGFDHGNSPAEFAPVSLKGKSAVLWTTNGTKAIAATRDSPRVLIGALLNRHAVARRLVDEARASGAAPLVLCAGNERGAAFSLEDSACAGAIVEAMRDLDSDLDLADSAWAVLHLWRWYRGDAMRAFRQSTHGRALAAAGFEQDLALSARLDVSDTVPTLYDEDGVKTIRAKPKIARGKTRAGP